MKTAALVLAAGQGKRMNSTTPKQFLLLGDKPVLYYSLKRFEESSIDKIILVAGKDEIEYCKYEIVEKYGFSKVCAIVAGGTERYDSVWNGLQELKAVDYVFIHDGARPFITIEEIERLKEEVIVHKACVAGMPVKDTIKIADSNGLVESTPDRQKLWLIQTPQVFEWNLIYDAYEKLMAQGEKNVTDDAMVVETLSHFPVKLVMTSYKNIKITTQEDLLIGDIFCG